MAVFRRNPAGFRHVLNRPLTAQVVHRTASGVADAVQRLEPDAEDVVVDDYQTDRAASSVTVREPQAKVWAVRDGLWSKAAASVGLEVADR
jgi:hypothetical protein